MYYGGNEERFCSFAASAVYCVRSGKSFRAGVNWSIAASFAGELADGSRSGGEGFQRAWVLLTAIEAAHDELKGGEVMSAEPPQTR